MPEKAKERDIPFFLDPGAFNAALFEAYAGKCDCMVCKILRAAVKKAISKYIPGGGKRKSG